MPRQRPIRGDAPKLNIVGLCKQIANLANLEFAKSDAIRYAHLYVIKSAYKNTYSLSTYINLPNLELSESDAIKIQLHFFVAIWWFVWGSISICVCLCISDTCD